MTPGGTGTDVPYVVLIPVFNDWAALGRLLDDLDCVLAAHDLRARVLIVNDGSTQPRDPAFLDRGFAALPLVECLELRCNLGHQRAIAVGLAYVEARLRCEAVIVMDGDGEDAPRDVPALLAECRKTGGQLVVFAERTRRSESWQFRFFYQLFRAGHRVLTGHRVRVGNFSVVPAARLGSLVVVSEMWNHYAAAVLKSRQPWTCVPTERARRLAGGPQMNFVGLVIHGLSALSVFGDTIGVRLLVGTTLLIVLTLLALAGVLGSELLAAPIAPGWATAACLGLVVILLQAILFSFVFVFVILANRHGATFLPLRDYGYFVREVVELSRRE